MYIGICDDDRKVRIKIKTILAGLRKQWETLEFLEYESGDELLHRIIEEPIPEILFMDVEMKGKNGIETAEILRAQNQDVTIIFVSSYQQYIFKSFYVKAFYFLVKPIDEEELLREFDRAMCEYRDSHIRYEFSYNGRKTKLQVKDIYYISGYYRQLTVFTEAKSYSFDGSLNEVQNDLSMYGFIRVHQGFIVNMRYIKEIGEKKIRLINNIEVDISVRKRGDVKRMYNTFLLGGVR
ncbi:two-component response regulator [Lachnospiraceae bacterium KM106-2]|nr:two-component response regulator [Lachnospiraceae bacterium KM106-2]